MDEQLKSDTKDILIWAQKRKKKFSISDFKDLFVERGSNASNFPHDRIEFALNFLVSDKYLSEPSYGKYYLEAKGTKFKNWEEVESQEQKKQRKFELDLVLAEKTVKYFIFTLIVGIAGFIIALILAINEIFWGK